MNRSRTTWLSAILLATMVHAGADAAVPASSVADEKAVIALDEAWGEAEQRGDVATVEAILLPGYRSIGADGSVHDRKAILDNTRRNAGSDEHAKRVADWKANHPSAMSIDIRGDTALLTFLRAAPGEATVFSCDVFVRLDGQWRALYSQHTTAEGS